LETASFRVADDKDRVVRLGRQSGVLLELSGLGADAASRVRDLVNECLYDLSALRQEPRQFFAHEIERSLLITAIIKEMIELVTKGNHRQLEIFANTVSCSPFCKSEN